MHRLLIMTPNKYHRRPNGFTKREIMTDAREHYMLKPWEQRGFGAYAAEDGKLVYIYNTECEAAMRVSRHNDMLRRLSEMRVKINGHVFTTREEVGEYMEGYRSYPKWPQVGVNGSTHDADPKSPAGKGFYDAEFAAQERENQGRGD